MGSVKAPSWLLPWLGSEEGRRKEGAMQRVSTPRHTLGSFQGGELHPGQQV